MIEDFFKFLHFYTIQDFYTIEFTRKRVTVIIIENIHRNDSEKFFDNK